MGQTTFYSARYQCWPPVANRDINDPNSYHWQNQAQAAQRRLNEALGGADYETWVELTFPGETIDSQSWKQVFDSFQWALDHLPAVYQQLDCTCNPAGMGVPCPVCQANARIRERGDNRD